MPELVIENGAGLSRVERIAPRNLARLLAAAWQSPYGPELASSLPIAGVDGTLKRRFNDGSPVERPCAPEDRLSRERARDRRLRARRRWPHARRGEPHQSRQRAQRAGVQEAVVEWALQSTEVRKGCSREER